ncbi:S1C family serine protease [Desulfoscipio gibsoniae]|uniref:Trypsin-like serine protease with C-terminal PDZ domain n=1 Tax=Desulfoscipio gibsoniae DSM 7213 TaxID=767817 RepID=R4KC33_9FIRM|nr:serine protease [Desulfoscipio gibsoniae]AGL00753.1 trypsin-like serine protease with C-terminal PDZ domain [Desulfoscipio gibsoniae DSM 7213]
MITNNKNNKDGTDHMPVERGNKNITGDTVNNEYVNNQNNEDKYNDDEYFADDYEDYCDYIADSFSEDGFGDDGSYNREEADEHMPSRPSWPLRVVALVTALAFLGLIAVTSWPALQAPLGDLVNRSLQLEKDINIQRLQEAVVQIEVVARKQGVLTAVEQKSGTGFNIDPCGRIVTNHHVIQDALNIVISFPDGKIYKAANWASKPELDLAVVTLQADQLPVVPLNIQEQPVPGDKIRVVGNPLGLNNIVAEGQVEQYWLFGDKPARVFGISAPIYPGNSGSPVFDHNGQVVGVVFGNWHRNVDGVDKVTGLAVPIQELLDLHI